MKSCSFKMYIYTVQIFFIYRQMEVTFQTAFVLNIKPDSMASRCDANYHKRSNSWKWLKGSIFIFYIMILKWPSLSDSTVTNFWVIYTSLQNRTHQPYNEMNMTHFPSYVTAKIVFGSWSFHILVKVLLGKKRCHIF